jgi:hypothetical protein
LLFLDDGLPRALLRSSAAYARTALDNKHESCFVSHMLFLLLVAVPLNSAGTVELAFRGTDAVEDVVDHFCTRHAVRRAPCAQLLAHATSLRAAQNSRDVRFDVAIDRRVPLEIDGEERLWSIGLGDSAARAFCAAHAIGDCAALARSVRTERRERRAMEAGEVRVEVNGELFTRARDSGARFREGVLRAIGTRGASDAPVVAIWSQTLGAASGYVAGSEITSAGLARAFRGEGGAALALRFAGSVASNASHRAALDDALLLLPRLDLVVLEGHTPQVSFLLCTVTCYANLADSLTRSP